MWKRMIDILIGLTGGVAVSLTIQHFRSKQTARETIMDLFEVDEASVYLCRTSDNYYEHIFNDDCKNLLRRRIGSDDVDFSTLIPYIGRKVVIITDYRSAKVYVLKSVDPSDGSGKLMLNLEEVYKCQKETA